MRTVASSSSAISGLKARSWSSDGSSRTSTRGSSAGAAGKSSSIQSPSGSAPSTPLRVWKWRAPPRGASPSCQTTWAADSVACPQMSTSTVGENQRSSQSPSPRRTRNAVSERFISRATFCIQASSGKASSTHTAAGLPAKGRSVKASTVTIAVNSIGAGDDGDEIVLVARGRYGAVRPLEATHGHALLVELVLGLVVARLPRHACESAACGFNGLVDRGDVDGPVSLPLL